MHTKHLFSVFAASVGSRLAMSPFVLFLALQGPGAVSREQYLQMVGRAGRAGQSASGESFLLGSGEAFSCSGEWTAICALLQAPMPCLTSQLLPCVAAANTGEAAGAGAVLGMHSANCYLYCCIYCLCRDTLA